MRHFGYNRVVCCLYNDFFAILERFFVALTPSFCRIRTVSISERTIALHGFNLFNIKTTLFNRLF